MEDDGAPLTRVDRAESQSEQTIIVLILLELSTDLRCKLNSLVGDCYATNIDGVEINVSTGTRPISIGDVPGRAVKFLGSVGLGWVIERMALSLSAGKFRRENPSAIQSVRWLEPGMLEHCSQVCRASVEIKIERLATDGDG